MMSLQDCGQEVGYLRVFLRGFGYTQKKPTDIWEDNASRIIMRQNPTNLDRSRHVDVKVHYLRDLLRDGHVKLVKCAGTQNVSDTLTKSLVRPDFEKHREYMWGTRVHFSDFFSTVETKITPVMTYCIQLPKLIPLSMFSRETSPVALSQTCYGSKSLKVILMDSNFGGHPVLNPLVTL